MIKDAEIDLTEHRDFNEVPSVHIRIDKHNEHNFIDYVTNQFYKMKYGNIPWSVTPLKRIWDWDSLVVLGNSEERKEQMESMYWGSTENITCDCCGKIYLKVPWKINYGFCDECDKLMKKDLNKDFPWN